MSQPPPPGQPPDPPSSPGERRTSGQPWQAFLAALLGVVVFVVVNTVLVLGGLAVLDLYLFEGPVLVVGMVILLLVALAGIPLVVRGRSYFVKGLGLGLMLGWALASIVSGGVCIGIMER